MAQAAILSKNGLTIYPATIPDAIIDPETGLPINLNTGGLTEQAKTEIVNSAVAAVGNNVTAAYNGPFAVSISNGFVHINSGTLYLGGTELTIDPTSMVSTNGNVYFYAFHDGSYNFGFEIASTVNNLTNVEAVTGSAGYYTAIANISNNLVTQYQYGNISINGRIQ